MFIELEPMVSAVGPASPVLDLGVGVPVGSSLGLFRSREGGSTGFNDLSCVLHPLLILIHNT